MAVSAEYKEFLIDLLSPLGPIKIRSMFGGGGVFYKDVMFGLISDETLFFKVDDEIRLGFEEEGSRPFVFGSKNKPSQMSYWTLPERLYDDADELMLWARRSIEVALKAKAKSPKKKKTKKPI